MNNSISQIALRVIQNLESGVLVIDKEGTILIVNPAASKHLKSGYKMLLPGENIFQHKELTPFADIYKELLNKKEPISRRKISIEFGKDEDENILGLTSSLIKKNNKIIGAVFLFTDLTQIKKLQRESEINKQLAQIGELTAGIIHEFRNPLGIISGMTELLMQRNSERPEIINDLKLILREIDQLNMLVNQFLGFAKPQEIQIQKQTTESIINKSLEICSHLIDKYSANIELGSIPKSLQIIYADPDKLTTAIANLIRNAIEVQGEQKKIWVRLSLHREGKSIVFCIEDNGPGLPEKIKKNDLFKPFVSSKKGGTGLGLSIVQRIVIAHHGWINCSNREPRGAIFEMGIPLKPVIDFPETKVENMQK
ncbi:MAG TPA: ATP-binding protein [Candidatus Hydrogenedens sp.]|nr:ATP-binding protein [Candidatus Hydrogenedens sp.]